jgi:hypothetical protein
MKITARNQLKGKIADIKTARRHHMSCREKPAWRLFRKRAACSRGASAAASRLAATIDHATHLLDLKPDRTLFTPIAPPQAGDFQTGDT